MRSRGAEIPETPLVMRNFAREAIPRSTNADLKFFLEKRSKTAEHTIAFANPSGLRHMSALSIFKENGKTSIISLDPWGPNANEGNSRSAVDVLALDQWLGLSKINHA